ncbi:YceD family protein [Methylobacillus flagellatus]|uniref:YceD family protein n=1 Tax=Methylobacillus flagellatus TaxID=405 RepID=UPI0010F9E6F3|nr:YceD family protein [Methylobacillus flagellatus]
MTASANITATINSLEFARKRLEIHDTIAVFRLTRLGDLLTSQEGELSYTLSGFLDEQSKPGLRLAVSGKLMLSCQRCLGPYACAVDTVSQFELVAREEDIPLPEDEDDERDFMVASANMSVQDLIEDELLLALPLAPRHDDGQCGEDGSAIEKILRESNSPSPFALLEQLKRRG